VPEIEPEVVTLVRVPHVGLVPETRPAAPPTLLLPVTLPDDELLVRAPAVDTMPASPPR
jgi:hypothetical protein